MEYVQAFFAREASRLSPETVRAYRRELKRFARYGNITNETVALYLHDRAAFSKATLARAKSALRAYFSFLAKSGVRVPRIAWNRISVISRPVAPVSEPERKLFLTVFEETGIDALRCRAICHLLMETGMRVSELVALKRLDFSLVPPRITFGCGRKTVSLSESTATWIQRCFLATRQDASEKDPPLFSGRTGAPLSRQSVWKLLRMHAAYCGIETPVSPQTLRAWYQESHGIKKEG